MHDLVTGATNFAIFSSAKQRFLMGTRLFTFAVSFLAVLSISIAGQAPRLTRVAGWGSKPLEPMSTVRVAHGTPVTLGIELEKQSKYYDIQWFRNDEPLTGATTPEIRITSASAIGTYHAVLSTPCTQIRTSAVTVELDQPGTGVVSRPSTVSDVELEDVYPNPVTERATITFRLPKPLPVVVRVTDLVGNTVATLVHSTLPGGIHSIEYNVIETPAASTLYNVVLEAPGYSVVKPMLVVK